MKIQGIEGMSPDEIRFEVQRGAKFVFFYYSVSVIVMSFRRPSPVYFIRDRTKRAEQSAALDLTHAACRLVGNSLGTDLHGSISAYKL
jgi:hypothetical protein